MSQNSEVSVNNIKWINGLPLIQIIDTPLFENIKGITQVILLTSKIGKTFKEALNSLNDICFLVQLNKARLTINQKYIFTSVLDSFCECTKDTSTFCVGGIPQAVSSIRRS